MCFGENLSMICAYLSTQGCRNDSHFPPTFSPTEQLYWPNCDSLLCYFIHYNFPLSWDVSFSCILGSGGPNSGVLPHATSQTLGAASVCSNCFCQSITERRLTSRDSVLVCSPSWSVRSKKIFFVQKLPFRPTDKAVWNIKENYPTIIVSVI